MLELDQISRGIRQHKGLVHLRSALEASRDLVKEGQLSQLCQLVDCKKVARLSECDAEVPRIKALWCCFAFALREMADHLIAEEVEGDPIGVPPCELAPEPRDIELFSRLQVVGGYREMEDVLRGTHGAESVDEKKRVRPQPEPDGLERDNVVWRDIAEIDVRTYSRHEVRLQGGCGRLEEEPFWVDP